MTGGQVQRIAGKDVTGPGTRNRGSITGSTPLRRYTAECGSDNLRVRRRAGGIVAAAHVHVDVCEAMLGEMGFEGRQRFRGGHVGHEAHIDFGDGFAGEDGFAARSGVAADQPSIFTVGREVSSSSASCHCTS